MSACSRVSLVARTLPSLNLPTPTSTRPGNSLAAQSPSSNLPTTTPMPICHPLPLRHLLPPCQWHHPMTPGLPPFMITSMSPLSDVPGTETPTQAAHAVSNNTRQRRGSKGKTAPRVRRKSSQTSGSHDAIASLVMRPPVGSGMMGM